MKKKMIVFAIFFLPIIVISIVFFSGCSFNRSIIDLDYGFQTALVNEKGEWKEYSVKKWDNYDNDMVCVWTTDGKVIYTSSVNIILYGK